MIAQPTAQPIRSFLILDLPIPPRIVSGQNRNISLLVFLAFFSLFLALVVFAHDFPIGVNFDAPFFTTLVDHGFVVRSLFFPANNFAAFSLRLGGFHHRRRHVRTADGFFFVFLFFCLRDPAEGESGADHSDCEQLRCIHGYLIFDQSVSRIVRISRTPYAQKSLREISPDKDRSAAGRIRRGEHSYFAVASRSPRKTKSAPEVRFSHCEIVSLVRNRSLNADANQARMRHQIVPVVTNVRPSVMNAAIFIFDAGSMNCGRKARKKSATFGLSTFVKTPCRNAAALVRRRKFDGKFNCFWRSSSIL